MEIYRSGSAAETELLGERFAASLTGGEVLAFRGGLGMGKTCFVRGLARGLGFSGTVTSPTFALINEYTGGRLDLFHFDMYRVSGWEDLESTGYFDYLDRGGVVAVEWSENIDAALDDGTIFLTFEKTGEDSRTITAARRDEL